MGATHMRTRTQTHTEERKVKIILSTGNSDDENLQVSHGQLGKLALEQYMAYLICNFL